MKTALIFDCYDDYKIRIKFIKEAMERSGYTVHVFYSDFDHYSKEYVKDKRTGIEYLHALEYKKNLSYARIRSHLAFAKTCVKKVEEFKDVSLIYVMVPPNSMCREFAGYRRRHPEVKLMYDLCDMWPETLPIDNMIKGLAAPVLRIWRNYRDRYIGEADCVLSECRMFTEHIKGQVEEDRLHTVYLCQEHHEQEAKVQEADRIGFLYCGSINNIVNIEMIANLLSEINKHKRAVLHIIGDGERKEAMVRMVQAAGVEVVAHGTVYSEAEKQKIYDKCQYGLNLMRSEVFVGLTMKSLDYMSHDLPLINNIQGDTWELVENRKIGINIENGKEKKAAGRLLAMGSEEYQEHCMNTENVFNTVFNQNIISHQLDRILEEL